MKKTLILKIDKKKIDLEKIKAAAKIIKIGGTVAFPTETVYGLGADALNPEAVKKIFKAKNRPADNPIIVHVSNEKMVYKLTRKIPKDALKLMKKFWPGPLTLILKKSKIVPDIVTAGLDTVAIRMPKHRVAMALIRKSGVPIAAPSANLAGKPSPTCAEHVIQDLNEKIDVIIDAGRAQIGVESTVLDLTTKTPTLLRPGGKTLEDLESVIGKIRIHPIVRAEREIKLIAKSPGMKYRHYAPKAQVIVVEGNLNNVKKKIDELLDGYKKTGKRVGVMTVKKSHTYKTNFTYNVGKNLNEIAKNLFLILRRFDEKRVDVVLAEGVEEKGLGLAIMNRLRKSAGYNVIRV
jgi:L-threonylcarbamoyladenylate synthase